MRPDETRFGSPQQAARAGASSKPHTPKVIEEMRRRVEERVEQMLAPYFDALERAVLHATHEGKVRVSDTPDLGARQAAAERLLDRIYGKPRQISEVSGPDGGPIEAEVTDALLADDDTRAAAAELRRRLAARRAQLAGGAGAGD